MQGMGATAPSTLTDSAGDDTNELAESSVN